MLLQSKECRIYGSWVFEQNDVPVNFMGKVSKVINIPGIQSHKNSFGTETNNVLKIG